MKKNTILSIVAILMCFLVGYVAYESTLSLRNWVAGKLSSCNQLQISRCGESPERPVSDR